MEIKREKARRQIPKKRQALLGLLVCLIIFLLGIWTGLSLLRSGKIRYIFDAVTHVKDHRFKALGNSLGTIGTHLDEIDIDIKFRHLKKMSDQRQAVYSWRNFLANYPDYQWPESIEKVAVPARIYSGGESYKADIKIIGLNYDHFREPRKWSFRVNIKGDKTLRGMNELNLVVPFSRGNMVDIIGHRLSEDMGLIPLRYDFVRVRLNGEPVGVYMLEEFYDKRLIEFNRHREGIIVKLKGLEIASVNSVKSISKDSRLRDNYAGLQKKLAALAAGTLRVDDVFNIEGMAKRYAVSMLMGDWHSLVDFNARYYLNPITFKLEPLAREWSMEELSIPYDQFEMRLHPYSSNGDCNPELSSLINKSSNFKRLYFEALEEISQDNYLDTFFGEKDLDLLLNKFYTGNPFYEPPISIIKHNAQYIQKLLETHLFKRHSSTGGTVATKTKKVIGEHISGKWDINEMVIIPAGKTMLVDAGSELSFSDGGGLIAYGNLTFKGTHTAPITISASDGNSGSILVLNAAATSQIEHTHFIGLRNFAHDGWIQTGAITFYSSKVDFRNCIFEGNTLGDDFLNIVKSDFTITDCAFRQIAADAVDLDFSNGTIEGTRFTDINNDAIDASGSKIQVSDVYMNNVSDKGISAGENSLIKLDHAEIERTSLALASKDNSTIIANKIQINNCDVGFCVFQKKPEYGPGSIICRDFKMSGVKEKLMLEPRSSLILDDVAMPKNYDDVERRLYGVQYGRSSQ